jgi:hypothetical protein
MKLNFTIPVLGFCVSVLSGILVSGRDLKPVVEVEEQVYTFTPADNGAGPLWCHGSTSLVRYHDDVFASGIETLANVKPLNNCRWLFFHRDAQGWHQLYADPVDRTREPCPIAIFADGRILVSINPTLVSDLNTYSGPARPAIAQFSASKPEVPPVISFPTWQGEPRFNEHSYRSLAVDGRRGELVLFQNIDYTNAEWTFRDRKGQWSAAGQLKWPWGSNYAKPQPIRICYPNVVLHGHEVFFCGVSDIVEPNPAWREYKKQITGRDWDFDFRQLYFTWSPDITRGQFKDWTLIASRDSTCGWINPGDMSVGNDGTVHIIWTERALDERLRVKFFPEARQIQALNYAQVREGKVILRRTLARSSEGGSQITPGRGRFHLTPDGRLYVFYYVNGRDPGGQIISEDRLIELHDGQVLGVPQRVPLKEPFVEFLTATPRAGTSPSYYIDLLGQRTGNPLAISYARIKLAPR